MEPNLNPSEEFVKQHAAAIKKTEDILALTASDGIAWDGDDFAASFPDVANFFVDEESAYRLSVPLWLSVLGRPILTPKNTMNAALAVILYLTPIGMTPTQIRQAYATKMGEIRATSKSLGFLLTSVLPKCKITTHASSTEGEVATMLKNYLNEALTAEGWETGKEDAEAQGKIRIKFGEPEDNANQEHVTIANLWKSASDNASLDSRSFALMGASLFMSGAIKGLLGLQLKLKNWHVVTTSYPTEQFLVQGFSAQRKAIATTLCLVDLMVAKGVFALSEDPNGSYEKYISIRFRNSRLALISTVEAARRYMGWEMEKFVMGLLMRPTVQSWKRVFEFNQLICATSVEVSPSTASPMEVANLSPFLIPGFVAPYTRLFNDKCLKKFGTVGNEVLICLCAGLSSVQKSQSSGTWREQLENYQVFTTLTDTSQILVLSAVETARDEKLGVTEEEDTFTFGKKVQDRARQMRAESNVAISELRDETIRSNRVPAIQPPPRSRSTSAGSNASRRSVPRNGPIITEATADEFK